MTIPTKPHALTINGVQIYYVTWGQFDPQRAVLLVHGLTHNHMIWSELGPILAEQGWYVIAPDLRGRGWSGKPAHGFGIPYHVNDLLSLCDALGVARVHFVGHSLGALIGYFLVALNPHRLRSFVAIDAGGRAAPNILDILRPVLERLGHVYSSLEDYLQRLQQGSAVVHPWNEFWERFYRSDAEVRRDKSVISRASKAAIEEEMIVNSTINNDIVLPAIQVPTLLVRAGQGTYHPDWFIMSPTEAERVHKLIKGSQLLIIPDGNHYTLILRELFVRRLLDFLAIGEGSVALL